MKILITGGTGMVGKNLIEFLLNTSNYDLHYPKSSELNLLDQESVVEYIKFGKFEAIIHCAGLVGGI